MELLGKLSYFSHILAGSLTLLAGPLAIFYNFKNPKNHRRAGKTFFYAMLWVCLSAVFGYLKRPDIVFFQFLLGIAAIVFVGVVQGVRAIRLMKGGQVGPFDFAYSVFLLLTGGLMLQQAFALWAGGQSVMYYVLFGIFGLGALVDSIGNFRLFSQKPAHTPAIWYRMHLKCMFGAFTASTTAFSVQTLHMLPWWVQWFGPTLLLVPAQIWFTRKIGKPTMTSAPHPEAAQNG